MCVCVCVRVCVCVCVGGGVCVCVCVDGWVLVVVVGGEGWEVEREWEEGRTRGCEIVAVRVWIQ